MRFHPPPSAVLPGRQELWRMADFLATLCGEMKRKILIILSNRYNRTQKPRFLELDCDAQGNILKQRPLRGMPGRPHYHEVWENDEGRTDFTSCRNFRRHYRHKLQKPSPPARQRSRS